MSHNQWNTESLEHYRSVGDPLADQLIAEILDQGEQQTWTVTQLFSAMTRNSSPAPEELPASFQAYFEDNALPTWADPNKLRTAQKLFGTYGVEVVMILFCKSLPLSYSCWRGAQVLTQTGRLTENTLEADERFAVMNRRIMETAQFVLNSLEPMGFSDSGAAIRTTQKIRLIHAAIRHYLLADGWDSEKYGLPINQEDLAGTLMSFSYIILQGLEELGLNVTEEEKDAYVHCWNVIGYFIGLDKDLLPENYAGAKTLTRAILDHQKGSSEAGNVLTDSLADYIASMMPGPFSRSMPPILMRFFVGNEYANLLGIHKPNTFIAWIVMRITSFFCRELEKVEESSDLMQRISRRAARHLLQGLTLKYNDYKQVEFLIPLSLQEDWQI